MTQGHPFNRIVTASCAEDCKAILLQALPVRRKNERFTAKGKISHFSESSVTQM